MCYMYLLCKFWFTYECCYFFVVAIVHVHANSHAVYTQLLNNLMFNKFKTVQHINYYYKLHLNN